MWGLVLRFYGFCIVAFLVFLVAALLGYVGMFGGNVRTVEQDKVYRSGQLRGRKLEQVLRSRRIRSIINLRGPSPLNVVLNQERILCKKLGIGHVDIAMSARRLPSPEELRKLLDAFDTLPRPILIHCAGGSDRSGLASTLYAHIYQHIQIDQAESKELTWRYGHLSFGKAHPMDDFFTLYRETSDGLPIREWIQARYPEIYAQKIHLRPADAIASE